MKNINIIKTDNTPNIIFDYESGFIEFDGKSYPENTFDFYNPLLEWLKEYFTDKAQDKTTVSFKLTYFNSATTQILFDILDIINDGDKKELVVNWYYDGDNDNGLEDYEDISDEFEELDIKAITY